MLQGKNVCKCIEGNEKKVGRFLSPVWPRFRAAVAPGPPAVWDARSTVGCNLKKTQDVPHGLLQAVIVLPHLGSQHLIPFVLSGSKEVGCEPRAAPFESGYQVHPVGLQGGRVRGPLGSALRLPWVWCPGWDLNPHSRCRKKDFKSVLCSCKQLRVLELHFCKCEMCKKLCKFCHSEISRHTCILPAVYAARRLDLAERQPL
jgi:hypothetical protein